MSIQQFPVKILLGNCRVVIWGVECLPHGYMAPTSLLPLWVDGELKMVAVYWQSKKTYETAARQFVACKPNGRRGWNKHYMNIWAILNKCWFKMTCGPDCSYLVAKKLLFFCSTRQINTLVSNIPPQVLLPLPCTAMTFSFRTKWVLGWPQIYQ